MKKYKTRSGCEVRIFTEDSPEKNYPKAGVVFFNNKWWLHSWTADNRTISSKDLREWDLVEIHPCDGMKSGDPVKVWEYEERLFTSLFIGINRCGRVVAEDKTGIIRTWSDGRPLTSDELTEYNTSKPKGDEE